MSTTTVEPVARLVGHIAVPGDKSISHRAVLVGSLCEGRPGSTASDAPKTPRPIAAVRELGVDVYEHDVDTLRVFGVGRRLRAPVGRSTAGTRAR